MNASPLVSSLLPAFGSFIPGQGGHFAAILRQRGANGQDESPYALIVAPATSGELESSIWGVYRKTVPGADSRVDGKANTAAMLACQECPAAQWAARLDIDGHTDWYIPSLGELNSAAANVPELFTPQGWYWTSTQYSPDHAFVVGFEYGYSFWSSKGSGHRVRAVRRIPLELLIA